MNPQLKKRILFVLTDYGMVIVLLFLCVFFSAVTFTEQVSSGTAAAEQVANRVQRDFPAGSRLLVVASQQSGDKTFADALGPKLEQSGYRVFAVVKGDPRDARRALLDAEKEANGLAAIACSQSAGQWLVFADLATDFPELGNPPVLQPRSYRFPNFLKPSNLLNITNQIAVIAIVAIGMTLVIVSGGIDLSVGSLIALSAVLCTWCVRQWFGGVDANLIGMLAAGIVAMLACGMLGAFSGVMVTQFAIPPFIGTLAMMLVASGFAYLLADGQSIGAVPDSFVWLGREADLFGLPNAVVLMLILYLVAHVVMARMKFGRHLYAVGGNREAARLSGVPVRRVILLTYVFSGLLAGLGGVVMASQLKSGSPAFGTMYELYVIAAVVVGGTSLSGGEGKILGTLIGAFTIAVIQNGMNLTNVESYTQKVVLGLVILGAVLLDRFRHRHAN